jgi:hypothetical protein
MSASPTHVSGRVDRTTRTLIERIEACELLAGEFHHRDHVRAAWGMLREHGMLDTLNRYPRAIRRLATHFGAQRKYHETITWAFVFLIHQRMAELGEGHSWAQFVAASDDLLVNYRAALLRTYCAEQLDSDLARRTFLLPRPLAQAASGGS